MSIRQVGILNIFRFLFLSAPERRSGVDLAALAGSSTLGCNRMKPLLILIAHGGTASRLGQSRQQDQGRLG